MTLPIDLTTIIFIIFGIIIIILGGFIVSLNGKLKKFLIGSSTENLNDSISTMNESIAELETFRTGLEDYLILVEKRLKKSVQAVNTVRFNPFKGTTGSGGNQSFATAFINEEGDGVVVSSLYAREHVSIFSKPVKKGVSEFELSEEEKEAVAGAIRIIKHTLAN